jgi:hypothetical protein
MALDLTPLDRAVSQLQTFYTLSMQPQEQAVMAEALRMAAILAFESSYELTVKMLRRFLEDVGPCRVLIRATSSLVRTGRFGPGILPALICAFLNLSFIHSGADVWRSMVSLQCFGARDCFTDLVWML